MRLYVSPASPFVAKVRMAARHCGLEMEEVPVDVSKDPADLLEANPLGKIPALVTDDGATVYDSRVICDLFDRMTGNQLEPQTIDGWRRVKVVEALADGITDALILKAYEGRFRPEEKRHQPWVDRQEDKAARGLTALATRVADLPSEWTIGHFAVAALLSWMELRLTGRLEREHPDLKAWLERFATAFPAYEETKPKQP